MPDDHKNKIKQQRLVWGLTGVADLSIKRRRLSLNNDDSNTVPAAAWAAVASISNLQVRREGSEVNLESPR